MLKSMRVRLPTDAVEHEQTFLADSLAIYALKYDTRQAKERTADARKANARSKEIKFTCMNSVGVTRVHVELRATHRARVLWQRPESEFLNSSIERRP